MVVGLDDRVIHDCVASSEAKGARSRHTYGMNERTCNDGCERSG